MEESKLIELITAVMPPNPQRKTPVFTADAEHLQGMGMNLLVTMDDFSAEDLMRENHPRDLGWNWAAASLSDIYAAGGRPWQYGHSMTVPDTWSEDYIKKLMEGVAEALKEADCGFFGGDTSRGSPWKYTSTVLGLPGSRVLTRVGAQAGDKVFLTGPLGLGNYEAALNLYQHKPVLGPLTQVIKNRFPLRRRESEALLPHAHTCIDTSDGVFSALNTLSELNGLGYRLTNLPMIPWAPALAQGIGLSPLLLFLGGCGEYELLFTLSEEASQTLLAQGQKQKLKFLLLGEMTDQPGEKTLVTRKGPQDLNPLCLNPRGFPQVKDYLEALIAAVQKGGFHV